MKANKIKATRHSRLDRESIHHIKVTIKPVPHNITNIEQKLREWIIASAMMTAVATPPVMLTKVSIHFLPAHRKSLMCTKCNGSSLPR